MKLYLTVLNDDGSENYEIGEFEHVKNLRDWTNGVTDEDIFIEE